MATSAPSGLVPATPPPPLQRLPPLSRGVVSSVLCVGGLSAASALAACALRRAAGTFFESGMPHYRSYLVDEMVADWGVQRAEAVQWIRRHWRLGRIAECVEDPADPARPQMAWALNIMGGSVWDRVWVVDGHAEEAGGDLRHLARLLTRRRAV